MTIDQLLGEVRRAIEGKDPDAPAVRRKLSQIINRTGAAELLTNVLREGSLFEAHLAAIALPYARSELVRRGLRREAKQATGERRAAFLAALTEQELEQVLADSTQGLADDLVQASGMLAVNSPREFVDLLCDGSSVVDARIVEHVERVRRTFGIGAASLYGPLLERRLRADARRQVISILGREPGDEVTRLLEREQARATGDEDRRHLRREQMRQASLALSPEPGAPSAREGVALLSPVGPGDSFALELFEQLGDDRVLRTTVLVALGGAADRISTPEHGSLESIVAAAEANLAWARLALGQARALLEALPAKRREVLAPLLDRLGAIAPEALAGPAPEGALDASAARSLVRDRVWRDWRPLSRVVQIEDDESEQTAALEPAAFPGSSATLAKRAAEALGEAFAKRGFPQRLAAGFRHMALVMQLRGDPRAGSVAQAAVLAARRRVSPLALALAERELWLQLWSHGRLPKSYRESVRAEVRRRVRTREPGWDDVQRLDLAQAAAEGLARGGAEESDRPGLPPPESLDLDAALALAERARASFADPALRKQARAGTIDGIADAARAWVNDAPVPAAFELAQFASTTCFGSCPHRCFERAPEASANEVFRGPCPSGEPD